MGDWHEPSRKQNPLDIPEILHLVCSYLDRGTVVAARRVSKAWHACCYQPLWSRIGPQAWTNPYLRTHWKDHAHLIQHLSLDSECGEGENDNRNSGSANECRLQLLHDVANHCQGLVSIDLSQLTVPHQQPPSSSPSLLLLHDLTRLLLHNHGQLRSLRLSLQGRIHRDLVQTLGNCHALTELSLDGWTDFDEYSLQLVLLEACPPYLSSLSLSDNDFTPFDLESLAAAVVGCQQQQPGSVTMTRSSTNAITPTAAWARDKQDSQKWTSGPVAKNASNTWSLPQQHHQYHQQRRQHYRDGWVDDNHNSSMQPTKKEIRHNIYFSKEHKDNQHLRLGSTYNLAPENLNHASTMLHQEDIPHTLRHSSGIITTTQIRSLTLHRVAFRQGFLLNLVSLCPQLEQLSLLDIRGFFPTSTFTSRLARLCPRLHIFEFSSSAQGGSRQDLADSFFVSLLERYAETTTHLVVGPCTGFSLGGWRQLLKMVSQRHDQLVHLNLDGVRGIPSKSFVQMLELCSSLKHLSARGVVLNGRDVQDPDWQPWACHRLRVLRVDIEIYNGAAETAEKHDVETVRQRVYGQLARLGFLVEVGLGGGHSLPLCHMTKAGSNSSIRDEHEVEPGVDLSRRSGVGRLKGCWPFLEVLDITRLVPNNLDEEDEAWIINLFPRLRRIVVAVAAARNNQDPPHSSYTHSPLRPPLPLSSCPWVRRNRPGIIIDEV